MKNQKREINISSEVAHSRPSLLPIEPVPPSDIYAERAILSLCMAYKEVFPKIRTYLVPDMFYNDVHRLIYEAMSTIHDRGGLIDSVSVISELKKSGNLQRVGGVHTVLDICDSFKSMSYGPHFTSQYVNSIATCYTSRELRNLYYRLFIQSATEDPYMLMQEATNQMEKLKNSTILYKGESANSIKKEMFPDNVSEVMIVDRQFYSQFPSVSEKIGGFKPGEFIIIAARPSVGKTALALQIANHISKDHRVLFVSIEMNKRMVICRLLSSITEIPLNTIINSRLSAEDTARLRNTQLSNNLIIVDDTSVSVSDVSRMIATHKPDILFVDYLQLMRDENNEVTREAQVSNISRGLKRLSKDFSIPIIALSQLSRESERRADKRPVLSDLRESGSIEQDADIVMFIYRPGYYKDDEPVAGTTELLIRKNRNGPLAVIPLKFIDRLSMFSDPSDTELNAILGNETLLF